MRDNGKIIFILRDAANSGDKNTIKKETEEILKYKDIPIRIRRLWNVKIASDASNNRSSWNHLKIIQKIADRPAGKARHGTKGNSNTVHCTHTAGNTDVKIHTIKHGK